MFAFVDESGNTGANLFDPEQPDFFTAALITRSHFDLVYSSRVRTLCKRQGIECLHASVLGFGPIEAIASELLMVLKKADAHFFVSRVEKRYLLATKIFDTFFDSGENPAVPWHVYNIKHLKLVLCFKLATLITDDVALLFWKMLLAKTEKQARSMLPQICVEILNRVPDLADQRSRDIVTNALTWSHDHPQALDIFINRRQAKNHHLPNMVAFGNLLDGLEGFSKRWNRPVRKIIHDRQSQFEGSLREWHEMFSTASDEPIYRPGETIILQKVVGSTFDVAASDESVGIQIVDTVLWLYKQFVYGRDIPPNSFKLLNYVFKRGYHSDFSFDGVGKYVQRQSDRFMEADLTEEAWEFSKNMLENSEEMRQRLTALYEADGLMPYERDFSLKPLSEDS